MEVLRHRVGGALRPRRSFVLVLICLVLAISLIMNVKFVWKSRALSETRSDLLPESKNPFAKLESFDFRPPIRLNDPTDRHRRFISWTSAGVDSMDPTSHQILKAPQSWMVQQFNNICYDVKRDKLLYVTDLSRLKENSSIEDIAEVVKSLDWRAFSSVDRRTLIDIEHKVVSNWSQLISQYKKENVWILEGNTWILVSTLSPSNIYHWFESVVTLFGFLHHRMFGQPQNHTNFPIDQIWTTNQCSNELSSWKLGSLRAALNSYSGSSSSSSSVQLFPCRQELLACAPKSLVCFRTSFLAQPQSRWRGMFFSKKEHEQYLSQVLKIANPSLRLDQHNSTISNSSDHVKSPGRRLLFLQRRSEGRRSRTVANEKEFVSFLQEHVSDVDVQRFDPDTPFSSQVHAFQEADIVISIHGSGLTNILFQKPGSVLVEIFPFMWYKRVYQPITKLLGIHHLVWHNTIYENAKWTKKSCYQKMKGKRPEDCYEKGIGGSIPKFNRCDKECVTESDTIIDLNSFKPVLEEALRLVGAARSHKSRSVRPS